MRRTDRKQYRFAANPIRSVRQRAAVFCACALLALACAGPAIAAAPLVFAGSGTNLPLVRVLAAAFEKRHPEIKIEVPASIGSSGAILAAADGAIALGLISRPLKEQEQRLGLTVRNYARSPLLIAVHPSVAEANLTSAELLDIYRGKKTTWQDGREIVVLTREPGDSSIEVLVRGVPGFAQVYEESRQAQRWTVLLTDLTMNETLAKTPYAIGVTDLGAVTIEKHALKPLRLNGVAPTIGRHRSNDRYPLFKTLAFAYRPEQLAPEARLFLDFVRSPEGERLLLANGYLPEK